MVGDFLVTGWPERVVIFRSPSPGVAAEGASRGPHSFLELHNAELLIGWHNIRLQYLLTVLQLEY